MANTSKIYRDEIGLYVSAGGWKSRPVDETRFEEGDFVRTHHYGGSILAGVGKDKTCEHGVYLELWMTTGILFAKGQVHSDRFKTEQEQVDWYKDQFQSMYGE